MALALALLATAAVALSFPWDPQWGSVMLHWPLAAQAAVAALNLVCGLGLLWQTRGAARPLRWLQCAPLLLLGLLDAVLLVAWQRFMHDSAPLPDDSSFGTRVFVLNTSQRYLLDGLMPALRGTWVLAAAAALLAGARLSGRTLKQLGYLLDLLALAGLGLLFSGTLASGQTHTDVLKLAVPVWIALRLSLRVAGPGLAAIEGLGLRPLVAARQLRSVRRGFLATIGLLALLAVSLSSCSLITTLAVMGGFRQDLKNKIVGLDAHVVIDKERAAIPKWRQRLATVRAYPGVRGATAQVRGDVMLSSATNLAGASLRGVEIQSVEQVTQLGAQFQEGSLTVLGEPRQAGTQPPLALGAELANSLRVSLGDAVDVVAPFGSLGPSGPMPKTRRFRVTGIIYTGMYEFDAHVAFTGLAHAQRFLGLGDDVQRLLVRTESLDAAGRIAAGLRQGLPQDAGLAVRDWRTENANLFGALALEKLAMFITLGLAVLVAGFCVFGTLSLMVREKRREVAILRTLGASRAQVIGIFTTQGLLLGVMGACAGLALGLAVIFAAGRFGIPLNPEVYYIDRLPIHTSVGEFVSVGAAAVLVCLVATLFPALSAGKLVPADALRYE